MYNNKLPSTQEQRGRLLQSGLFLFHHHPNRHISHGVLQSTRQKKGKNHRPCWILCVFDFSLLLSSMAAVDAGQEGVIPAASYSAERKLITWRHSRADSADSGFFIVPIHNIPLTGQSKLQYPNFSQRGNVNPCLATTPLQWGWGNIVFREEC